MTRSEGAKAKATERRAVYTHASLAGRHRVSGLGFVGNRNAQRENRVDYEIRYHFKCFSEGPKRTQRAEIAWRKRGGSLQSSNASL